MIEEMEVEDNNVCPPEVKPILPTVLITEHAYERAKERLGWKTKVFWIKWLKRLFWKA